MTDQFNGGVAKALDVVVRPLVNAVVFILPIVYVDGGWRPRTGQHGPCECHDYARRHLNNNSLAVCTTYLLHRITTFRTIRLKFEKLPQNLMLFVYGFVRQSIMRKICPGNTARRTYTHRYSDMASHTMFALKFCYGRFLVSLEERFRLSSLPFRRQSTEAEKLS